MRGHDLLNLAFGVERGSAGLTRRAALQRIAVGGAAAALAGRVAGSAVAQEAASPAASPAAPAEAAPSADDPRLQGTVRYQHPEKVYFYFPGFSDETVIASIYGIDVDTYRTIKGRFATAARTAAEELLGDAAFAAQVDALPFKPGETILAIGESETDDLQSWLEILRHLLDLRRGEDGIQVINGAISGQSTTFWLGRIAGTIGMYQPNWLFCSSGSNDLARQDLIPERTWVRPEETEANLLAMRQIAVASPGPEINWVWLNLPPIDEARVEADPGLRYGGLRSTNADIDTLNEVINRQPEPVVDLRAVFGQPLVPEFLEADGLHPTLAGQKEVVKAVVGALTA